MIVDWRMGRFVRLTGPSLKALIGISAAGIQHGEPGERREVHWRRSLAVNRLCPASTRVFESGRDEQVAVPARDRISPAGSVSGTISTGHRARCKTPSATLPRKRCDSGPRLWDPRTMRSTREFSAWDKIRSDGTPRVPRSLRPVRSKKSSLEGAKIFACSRAEHSAEEFEAPGLRPARRRYP